jgi:hypothetical protein
LALAEVLAVLSPSPQGSVHAPDHSPDVRCQQEWVAWWEEALGATCGATPEAIALSPNPADALKNVTVGVPNVKVGVERAIVQA